MSAETRQFIEARRADLEKKPSKAGITEQFADLIFHLYDLNTVKVITYIGEQGIETTFVRRSKFFESFVFRETSKTFKAGKFKICQDCIAKPGSSFSSQMQITTLCQDCNPQNLNIYMARCGEVNTIVEHTGSNDLKSIPV